MFYFSVCFGIVLEFGFDPVNYSVNEDAGSVNLNIGLMSGNINVRQFDVQLLVSTREGTATCKQTNIQPMNVNMYSMIILLPHL